ncbi:glycosyltransferase family 2 protein [Caldivirga maquilingensis]|uniref:Glycosyl transferase family 2 n=1 Tax=Caldivirga maquilingensis (strain ATCC 700844 / DSM 13496 / JCM 10307 / IC-167) TaxID=397948 RepID=A8M8V8_CALMQ|nr:glycosyltransferase family 2 protein [Caldivirga maquilingensis]ABW02177.1 glycosyl transferase family 2 [Caldivirga maquilingensis IC-167]
MLIQLLYMGLLLVLIHVAVPLIYYIIILTYARRPWLINSINVNDGELPAVSIIIPTYNEENMILGKLDNILEQNYPLDKIQLIISDSSSDNTQVKVEEWLSRHRGVNLSYIKGPRMGKGHALNKALEAASGSIIVTTDADSLWVKDSLINAVKWLSNEQVGLVSCVKVPRGGGSTEDAYRRLYNTLRIGESKIHSTVVFHGELLAVKGDLIRSIGGFPTDIGADDSYTGVRVASMGLRAVIPENVVCMEYVPSNGYSRWRVRRAQHLLQSFMKSIKLPKPSNYKPIYYTEAYIHLMNPWLLPIGAILLLASGSLWAYALIAVGLVLLVWSPFRAWVTQQFILMYAMVRNLWTKELMWEKISK